MAKGIALLLNKELKWTEIRQLYEQCNSKRIVVQKNSWVLYWNYNKLYFSYRKKDDVELILLSFATRAALEGQLLTEVALGMKIVLYEGMLLPRKVHKMIEEQKIIFCSVTPSLFRGYYFRAKRDIGCPCKRWDWFGRSWNSSAYVVVF